MNKFYWGCLIFGVLCLGIFSFLFIKSLQPVGTIEMLEPICVMGCS